MAAIFESSSISGSLGRGDIFEASSFLWLPGVSGTEGPSPRLRARGEMKIRQSGGRSSAEKAGGQVPPFSGALPVAARPRPRLSIGLNCFI